MKKISLALFLLVLFVFLAPITAAQFSKTNTVANDTFTDLAKDKWYYNDICCAYELGLMNGKGAHLFDPDGNLSIAQAITIVARIRQAYDGTGEVLLNSDGKNWYDGYVRYAKEKGILTENQFDSYDRNAKRYEVAALFADALPTAYYKALNKVVYIPDLSKSADYYEKVLLLYNAGIMIGNDDYGTFYPENTIKRSEVAAIVNRVALPENRLIKTLTKKDEVVPGKYELLRDLNWKNGFNVTGLDSSLEGGHTPYPFNYGDASKKPMWKLAQWDSKYDFCKEDETTVTQPDDGIFVYENPSKTVTINTNTGEIRLKLLASTVYDAPRKAGERWPHLLIEDTGIYSESENRFALELKNETQLRLHLKQKLSYFEDKMGTTANSALHAASVYLYLYVKGTNDKGKIEMMWFGIPLFDNRNAFPAEYSATDGGKSDASGLYIYNIPAKAVTSTSFFRENKPFGSIDNPWMNIDMDVLPYIQRALYLANNNNQMKGVTLTTAYIDGINLGWEMPGTYDAEMCFKELSLKSYVGTEE